MVKVSAAGIYKTTTIQYINTAIYTFHTYMRPCWAKRTSSVFRCHLFYTPLSKSSEIINWKIDEL